MCSKYKLHTGFLLNNSGNIRIDYLVIKIIFWLINKDNIIVVLC